MQLRAELQGISRSEMKIVMGDSNAKQITVEPWEIKYVAA